jgi:hypothetical protein
MLAAVTLLELKSYDSSVSMIEWGDPFEPTQMRSSAGTNTVGANKIVEKSVLLFYIVILTTIVWFH